jgi:hypothetical protein
MTATVGIGWKMLQEQRQRNPPIPTAPGYNKGFFLFFSFLFETFLFYT